MIEIKIEENEANQRMDKFLRKYLPNAPLSYIYKIIRKNARLNGKKAAGETILNAGDLIGLYISDEEFNRCRIKKKSGKAKKQFGIVYEDDNILIADKPKGLLIHGDESEKKNTLVNQVIAYLQEKGDYNPGKEKTFTPACVNRLDRNTSGLVIFGKNYKALQCLNKMMHEKQHIRKYYLAVVAGTVNKEMHLKGQLKKDDESNRVIISSNEDNEEGKSIETIVRPIACKGGYSLVEVELITGRTHQIRAHLSNIGCPVLGDSKYGAARANRLAGEIFSLNSQFLHAYKLKFEECMEPISYMNGREIISPLPDILENIRKQLF